MRIYGAIVGCVVAALTARGAGLRGYVLEQEIVRRSPRRDGTVREVVERKTVYLAGDRARLDDEYGESIIVRLGGRLGSGGEVTELDHLTGVEGSRGSYQTRSFRRLREQWKSVNAWLLEEIEQTPPTRTGDRADLIDQLTDGEEKWELVWKLPRGRERERLVRKYALPPEPPEVKVRAVEDEKKKILDVECVRYEVAEDGTVTDSAWIAPGLRYDVRYYEFMELSGWIRKALAAELRKVRGLPLASLQRTRTGVEVELRTRALEEKALDGSLFEIPADYRERKRKSAFR